MLLFYIICFHPDRNIEEDLKTDVLLNVIKERFSSNLDNNINTILFLSVENENGTEVNSNNPKRHRSRSGYSLIIMMANMLFEVLNSVIAESLSRMKSYSPIYFDCIDIWIHRSCPKNKEGEFPPLSDWTKTTEAPTRRFVLRQPDQEEVSDVQLGELESFIGRRR